MRRSRRGDSQREKERRQPWARFSWRASGENPKGLLTSKQTCVQLRSPAAAVLAHSSTVLPPSPPPPPYSVVRLSRLLTCSSTWDVRAASSRPPASVRRLTKYIRVRCESEDCVNVLTLDHRMLAVAGQILDHKPSPNPSPPPTHPLTLVCLSLHRAGVVHLERGVAPDLRWGSGAGGSNAEGGRDEKYATIHTCFAGAQQSLGGWQTATAHSPSSHSTMLYRQRAHRTSAPLLRCRCPCAPCNPRRRWRPWGCRRKTWPAPPRWAPGAAGRAWEGGQAIWRYGGQRGFASRAPSARPVARAPCSDHTTAQRT